MPKNNYIKISLKIICLCLSIFCFTNVSFADQGNEKNYFQFEVKNYHTTRQTGQIVSLYVRYAYKKNLKASEYPDYRELRKQAMKYLEPTEQFPSNVYWELLTEKIGKELLHNFPIEAISIQMEVLDNPKGNEPGNHGSIYTYGDILPLDIHI